MSTRTMALALLLAVGGTSLLAAPRDDCALIVSALGFPTDDYAFEEAGVFSMERHQFGALTCYVDARGTFDSLYRGDVPVAEDGYFGEDALAERNRLIAEAAQATDAAAAQRDVRIEAARTSYDEQRSLIEQGLDDALAALQALHDPSRSEVAATPRPTEAPGPASQERTPVVEATPEPDLAPAVKVEPVKPEPVATEEMPGSDVREMWVTAEHLAIRSCPSADCGQMSTTLFGNRQVVYEERDGWGRVSEPFDASCDAQGLSDMIDTGNRRCEPENGIVDGQVAQWLSLRYMTDERPADPAEDASGVEGLVAGSDNFAFHRAAFVTAAQTLLDEGRCTEDDFREIGGFFWAPSQGTDGYAIYCGGSHVSNRIYLNVETGELYR